MRSAESLAEADFPALDWGGRTAGLQCRDWPPEGGCVPDPRGASATAPRTLYL